MNAKKSQSHFYIYAYLDPRKTGNYLYNNNKLSFDYEPFYIGYGQGKRYLDHIKEANKSQHSSYKLNKIRKLDELDLKPIIVKLYRNLTKEEALLKEKEIIWVIGRSNLNMGPLTNLSWGGGGSSGYRWSSKQKEKLKDRTPAMLGKNHSKAAKEAMSDKKKGIPTHILGKKCYTNGKIDKYFIEGKQPKGWKLGKSQKIHNTDMKWYHNNKTSKCFKEGEQPKGWKLGFLANKGKPRPKSEEHKKCISRSRKKTKKYNNGIENRFFKEGKQPEGYVLGWIKK